MNFEMSYMSPAQVVATKLEINQAGVAIESL